MLFGFQFSVWLSTAVCFVLLLVSAFPKTYWRFQLMTPKCLTLNLWLWSLYQPPPSFACWGLPLAMLSCGGDHVYLDLACTLACNCHINCFVITAGYRAGSMQTDSPAYPTGLAALALCGCPLSSWGAPLLPSGPGDGAFLPVCLDRICPFYFASWSLNYSQQVPFTLGKSCSNFSLNYFLWGFGLDECTCSGVPVVIGL